MFRVFLTPLFLLAAVSISWPATFAGAAGATLATAQSGDGAMPPAKSQIRNRIRLTMMSGRATGR
jgi:hypothetical protein